MPSCILIVEDDRSTAEDLKRFLSAEFDCAVARDGASALAQAERREVAAALVDLNLGVRMDGFDVISGLRRIDPRTAVVVITADDTEESVRRARDLDVQDYIHKSAGPEELRRAVRRSLVLRRISERVRQLEEQQAGEGALLVAESPAMKRVLSEVERAARHLAPVLITGPVGAGKMLVATEIHLRSRVGRPFEKVHCSTLDTGDVADSQLFGYEPGAHSTATSRFIGAFERAQDGTLLLDDIDYLPVRIQAKLLQPLEDRFIRRLPGGAEIPVPCRVLATTNKDLDAMAARGSFRPDLLSRLRGGHVIAVPEIGDRKDDLPELVRLMTIQAARECARRLEPVPSDFVKAVVSRPWIDARQLHNAIRYAVGICEGGILTPELLPELPRSARRPHPQSDPSGGVKTPEEQGLTSTYTTADPDAGVCDPFEGTLDTVLNRARATAVRRALEACGGDKKAAAARLGITVQWLNALLRGQASVRDHGCAPTERE